MSAPFCEMHILAPENYFKVTEYSSVLLKELQGL